MKILVSFSGGKDSQACLIQAFKQYGGGNLTAVFCDTGWEHPDTYKHVNDVCLQMGVRLITLKSKYDFVSLAAHKKRFPSTNARFCTSELKMKPMIDYVNGTVVECNTCTFFERKLHYHTRYQSRRKYSTCGNGRGMYVLQIVFST